MKMYYHKIRSLEEQFQKRAMQFNYMVLTIYVADEHFYKRRYLIKD